MSAVTAGHTGKTLTRNGEAAAHQNLSERESMFGEMPGEIIDFEPATQLATVQPLYKPRFLDGDGNLVPVALPELLEVPVHFAHGDRGGMTYPLQAGDRVMLRPQMRSTELFHTTGEFVASDARSVSLSDMEAFYTGGLSMSDPIPNFEPENSHWRYDLNGQFGWHGSLDGRTKCELISGELMQMLIDLTTALSTEPELVNRPVYVAVLAQLTAARLP